MAKNSIFFKQKQTKTTP